MSAPILTLSAYKWSIAKGRVVGYGAVRSDQSARPYGEVELANGDLSTERFAKRRFNPGAGAIRIQKQRQAHCDNQEKRNHCANRHEKKP